MFSNVDYLMALREERRDGKKSRDDANYVKLKGLVRYLNTTNRSLILHAKDTGAWLKVQCTILGGTVLSAMKCSDLLCARYNVTPTNLQSKCDGCGTSFEVPHALSCRKVCLIIEHQN